MEVFQIINSWKELVDECDEGYNANVYELNYDMLIRKELEKILSTSQMESLEQDKLRVKEIDKKFIKNIIFLDNNVQYPYWERKFILKYGSKTYRDSVYDVHRLIIDVI